MTGFHSRFLLVIATTLGLATAARAEAIFPVNDPGNRKVGCSTSPPS